MPVYDNIEFNEIEHTRKVHKKKHYFIKFLIFLAVLGLVYLFLSSDYFTIRKIYVKGNHYYTKKEVINISDGKTGKNIFFKSGINEMKEELEKEAYFSEVSIKRKLPDTIIVKVKEREQLAAIAYGKKFLVIDKEGVLLRKTDVMPKLTLLEGLTINRLEEGEKVSAEEKENLSATLKLLHSMKKSDMYFKKVDVSTVVIRCYIYDRLIVKGTPNGIMEMLDSGNLQKLVTNLMEEGIERGTISAGGGDYMSFSPEV